MAVTQLIFFMGLAGSTTILGLLGRLLLGYMSLPLQRGTGYRPYLFRTPLSITSMVEISLEGTGFPLLGRTSTIPCR